MSRLSDQAHDWPQGSRLQPHTLQFIRAVGHYVNTGQNLQKHNNTPAPQTGHYQHMLKEGPRLSNGTFKDNSGNSESLIPLPDWSVALSTWGISWKFHIYGFSALFVLLTVVSLAIFLRFRPRVQRFGIVYNTLILLTAAGIFRSVFLLVDPYGYKGRMASLMVGVMTQAVYPLFCACYGLTQVMLIRLTNVDVGRSRLRTLSCLLGCTLTYLFVVVVIETLVSYQRSLKLLLLLDSGCFIVWSSSLGATFICSGFRLTQYAMETKKAHKQLNTFSNQRRSASNTTGLSAITDVIGDAEASLVNVDILSTVSDTLGLPATSDYISADETTSGSMQTFALCESLLPAATARPMTQVRLSRPRLKISDHDHMTITIATDDDDVSTSSTDADHPPRKKGTRRVRRVRKCTKQKRGNSSAASRSKSQTSSSVYRAVSAADDHSSSKTFTSAHGDNQSSDIDDEQFMTTLGNRTSFPNYGIPQEPSHESVSSFTCNQDIALNGTGSTFSELPLVDSPVKTLQKKRYAPKYKTNLKYDDDSEKTTEVCKQTPPPANLKGLDSVYVTEDSLPTSSTLDLQINNLHENSHRDACSDGPLFSNNLHENSLRDACTDGPLFSNNLHENSLRDACTDGPLFSNNLHEKSLRDACSDGPLFSNNLHENSLREACRDGPLFSNNNSCDKNTESLLACIPVVQPEHSSWRENGYLADTENIFSCSTFARLSNSFRRKRKSHDQFSSTACDVSPQRSSSSNSDDRSTASPVLQERTKPATSASLGLFRIRQSKVVQRAVHLTYLLTFLFMFASLLQLYTVFGVYGVLGTNPRPDPWPWLILHTIFRATEVSIGFSIATIAYITLNYRHQRAKRRHQQQQHLVATRDCIV